MNVYEKLMNVQSGLKAPKSQYNKFGNYNYRNCEDIQEAAKPLMKEVGATLIVGDELVQISDRFYIKATAHFVDCESGERVSNTAYAREELEKKGMDVSQVTGSTSSYARKYALNGLFCIDDVKDSDNHDNAGGKGAAKAPDTNRKNKTPSGKAGKPADAPQSTPDIDTDKLLAEKIDQAKLNVILGELKRTGVEQMVVYNLFGIKDLKEINNGQFVKLMNKFKATPSKEAQG